MIVKGNIMTSKKSKEEEKRQLFERDVSKIRDWAYAMANLIEAEVHLHQTYVETGNIKYLKEIEDLRKMRGRLFQKFLKNDDVGIWCISKHLLSLMMELSEVASKELDEGNIEEAKKYFEESQRALKTFVWIHSDEFIKMK